jgi:predicted RNase H-like HicB family nuclease
MAWEVKYMTAKISVVCQKQSNGSYFAICPELRACFTQGDTYEEALAQLKELAEITLAEEVDGEVKQKILTEKQYIFSEMLVEVPA